MRHATRGPADQSPHSIYVDIYSPRECLDIYSPRECLDIYSPPECLDIYSLPQYLDIYSPPQYLCRYLLSATISRYLLSATVSRYLLSRLSATEPRRGNMDHNSYFEATVIGGHSCGAASLSSPAVITRLLIRHGCANIEVGCWWSSRCSGKYSTRTKTIISNVFVTIELVSMLLCRSGVEG